jgi:hypothetical protein
MTKQNNFLSIEDELKVRAQLLDNHSGISKYHVHQLFQELDRLREDNKIDGPIFHCGRLEGRADIAVQLRKIVDPTDQYHLNLDGALKMVSQLVAFKNKAQEVFSMIKQVDVLKDFVLDDDPTIATMSK